jgi:hypothetical protein
MAADIVALRSAPLAALAKAGDVDKRLAEAFPATVRSALKPKFPGQLGGTRIGYDIAGRVSRADIAAALAQVEETLRPPDLSTIKIELARLRASTKAQAAPDVEQAMTMQVIAEQAQRFPADVVVAAFRSWAENHTFFPSLAEIRAEMRWRAEYRDQVRAALLDAKPLEEEESAAADDASAEEMREMFARAKAAASPANRRKPPREEKVLPPIAPGEAARLMAALGNNALYLHCQWARSTTEPAAAEPARRGWDLDA